MEIVTFGLASGTATRVKEYALLNPISISEIHQTVIASGFNISHVLGYVFYNLENPSQVVLGRQKPYKPQEGAEVLNFKLGLTYPAGGKTDKDVRVLAEAGARSWEDAYLLTFTKEMDELGGPTELTLRLLNRTPGLTESPLRSPDGRNLYLNDTWIREFIPRQHQAYEQRITEDWSPSIYDPLRPLIGSMSLGLDPERKQNGKYTTNNVFNIFIGITPKEIKELTERGYAEVNGYDVFEVKDAGRTYDSPVSTLMALGLFVSSPETFLALTGREMPKNMPTIKEIAAFETAQRIENDSLEEMLKKFLQSNE